MRQLVYSLFDGNNLVLFHLWWMEIVLKCDDCLKILVLVLTSFKIYGSFKNDQVLAEKTKNSTWTLSCFNWNDV